MHLGKVCLSSQRKWHRASPGGCEIYDPGGIRITFLNLMTLKSEAAQPPWGNHLPVRIGWLLTDGPLGPLTAYLERGCLTPISVHCEAIESVELAASLKP